MKQLDVDGSPPAFFLNLTFMNMVKTRYHFLSNPNFVVVAIILFEI